MRYKLLGKSGLRVSELALGTLTFGEGWGNGAPREECRRIFDAYLDRGGNFIDTANKYIDGTSEEFVGEFLAGRRERIVLATKFSLNMRADDPNGGGNHRKNLVQSLEASLRRLKTDYLDLYWLHSWDYMTPIDEVLRALDDLVRAGKVLYLGISNTPAWIVSHANAVAGLMGWTSFAAIQVEYSLTERTPEREFLPMARALDLAVVTWASLGGGLLSGKYSGDPERDRQVTRRAAMNAHRMTERNLALARKVSEVARQLGCTAAQVALNWVRQQRGVVIPIIGARTLAQLQENLDCLTVELPAEQQQALSEASAIPLGYPYDFTNLERIQRQLYGDTRPLTDNHHLPWGGTP